MSISKDTMQRCKAENLRRAVLLGGFMRMHKQAAHSGRKSSRHLQKVRLSRYPPPQKKDLYKNFHNSFLIIAPNVAANMSISKRLDKQSLEYPWNTRQY